MLIIYTRLFNDILKHILAQKILRNVGENVARYSHFRLITNIELFFLKIRCFPNLVRIEFI